MEITKLTIKNIHFSRKDMSRRLNVMLGCIKTIYRSSHIEQFPCTLQPDPISRPEEMALEQVATQNWLGRFYKPQGRILQLYKCLNLVLFT